MNSRPAFVAFAALMLAAAPRGETTTAPATLFDAAQHMRVDEVRPGMKGYGLSVFSGTKIERFDVEVISVLRNQLGPRQDVVLVRCSGQGLEHSGSISGMSGSPIFLKDGQGRERMIGAFALGWPFTKDAIAGVRPIEEMLRVPTAPRPAPEAAAAAGPWNGWKLLNAPLVSEGTAVAEASTSLRPLLVPLTFNGASESFIRQALPAKSPFQMTPLQTAIAGDAPAGAAGAKLERGSAIGVPIIRGDLDMAAIGTVTEVIGQRVYAFGHEFNSEGAVELPMGAGYIHAVIPNQNMSFKLGAVLETSGTLFSDESAGIAGEIGKVPAAIPVRLTVHTPQRRDGETFAFDVTRHPTFTPMGISMGISAAVMGHSRLPEEFTIRYDLSFEFDNGEKLKLQNTTTSLSQAAELVRDFSAPLSLAVGNPFRRTYPTAVTGSLSVEPVIRALQIQHAVLDKPVYRPGDTARVRLTIRPWKGQETQRTIEVKLPADLTDGPCDLTITDAATYLAQEGQFAPFRFQMNDIGGVFGLMRELVDLKTDRFYARLTTRGEGLAVGRKALPNLPASRRLVLAHTPRSNVVAYPQSITQSFDAESPVIGAASLQLMVSRHPERLPRAALQQPPAAPQTMPASPPAPVEPVGAPE